MKNLPQKDKILLSLIKKEEELQKNGLDLIASNNYASFPVLKAMASCLNNKYAEGYPQKRYYGGLEVIDEIENLAKKRAKELFLEKKDEEKWEVNVQPYSGAIANLAVYLALLKPGGKIMSLALEAGGHLSHGTSLHLSGQIFKSIFYNLDRETEYLNYEEILKIAQKEKPNLIVCGFSSYPRVVDFKKFSQIAKSVNAFLLADISHIAGLIVGGVHPSPFPWTDIVMTTTHKTLRGPRGAIIISKKELAEKINHAVFPGLQGGPFEHIIAAKAVCFEEAKNPSFKEYAKRVIKNAKILAGELKRYNFRIVSGGTDNHLVLIDLNSKNITGGKAERILESVGIYINKNMIPSDKRPPQDPSGIRLGTPAITSRGMGPEEIKKIAFFIKEALEKKNQKPILKKIKKEVATLCEKFPHPSVR